MVRFLRLTIWRSRGRLRLKISRARLCSACVLKFRISTSTLSCSVSFSKCSNFAFRHARNAGDFTSNWPCAVYNASALREIIGWLAVRVTLHATITSTSERQIHIASFRHVDIYLSGSILSLHRLQFFSLAASDRQVGG